MSILFSHSTYKLLGTGAMVGLLLALLIGRSKPVPAQLSANDIDQLFAQLSTALSGNSTPIKPELEPLPATRFSFVYFYLTILLFSVALIATLALLVKLRYNYHTQTWKLDDVIKRMAGELRTEIADVRDAQAETIVQQRRDIDSATSGITRLWVEVCRLSCTNTPSAMLEYASSGLHSESSYSTGTDSRPSAQYLQHQSRQHGVLVPSTKANYHPNKPFHNSYQSRGCNSGYSGDSNNNRIYKPFRRMQPALAMPKKTNILKTEFGTFDISTTEGRQRWISSIAERNETKGEPEGNLETKAKTSSGESADIEESGSSATPETANIEFLIPKLENRRPGTYVGSLAANVPTSKNETVNSGQIACDKSVSLVDNTATTTNDGLPLDSFQDLPPLTLDEMKAKLEEGVIKGYRRVFIPGRGWLALRKFQMEIEATEKQNA